tara:strand:- start:235 stop:1155 length:921 start_codon:yes stop_codon:yes gene_type:complete
MHFAIIAPPVPTQKWKENFERIAPHIHLVIGSETDHPEKVVCAMVWNQQKGALSIFKNLKLIFAMGAGVDHVLSDNTIPEHIPICRVVDQQMAFSMSNYILMAILNYHRSWYEFQDAQSRKHWAQFEFIERSLKIGVLGIGHLGMDAAKKIHYMGFPVIGYSNSPKKTIFPSYSGDQFDKFLEQINVLVCTVPYTPKTHGLLNYSLFEKLKEPTYLINVSRGNVQVEKDIIKALNMGLISGAFLDVFEEEPLPKASPLWSHPKVKITPHIASLTYPKESTRQVLNCFDRIEKGLDIPQQVSREKMY